VNNLFVNLRTICQYIGMNDDILSGNLAHNLIDLRSKRSLTQSGLAKLVGVPRSTISNMESGLGNPSLQTLARMAKALQTSIDQLLEARHAPIKLVAAAQIPVMERAHGGVKVFKLLPDFGPGLAIERLELTPGSQMKGTPHFQGTKEYLHCYQGEIFVIINGEGFTVKAGDVLSFPGDVKHTYANPLRSTAIGFSVVSLDFLKS
jgi:XRE family transcriptional regulator, regulator of sulfur utilization